MKFNSGIERYSQEFYLRCIIVIVSILGNSLMFAQWQPDQRLTNNPAISATSYGNAWCVAATGDTVHVVWYDYRDAGSPNGEIYYKRSTNGGADWGVDIRLTNNDSISHFPSVAATGANVHVVWEETRDGNSEIYYKRSADAGTTWGADTRLTNDPAASRNPSLAVYGTYVYVVWDDLRSGGSDIYYKRSTDAGTTWSPDSGLTNFQTSSFASVAAHNACVHVTYHDSRTGNMDIFYRCSTDGGLNWEPETQLTMDASSQSWPCVAISDTNIHVVWCDTRDAPNIEIYYKRSTDNGKNWDPDTRLTISPNSFYPSVAASGSLVHVTWRDVRGTPRIYYKRSTDIGVTWSPDTALPQVNVIQLYPSIAASDSAVHVVWWDQRDGPSGNVEIYYKRNPTGNTIGLEEASHLKIIDFKTNLKPVPNPFRSFTAIKGFENESFMLYDILGNLRGIYRGNRIGEGISSGVYFLRPETRDIKPLRVVKLR